MYGLQVINGEEVNEIHEYIGNLSGYDGQNFNPVVTTEASSGYGVSVDGEKIILNNDDTYSLRFITNTGNKTDWSWYYLFYPDSDLPKGKKLALISRKILHLYVLDRVYIEDKKGQYGVKVDSRIFAPIQKSVGVHIVPVKHSHWNKIYRAYDSSGYPDLTRTIEFNSDIENRFLDYDDLRRIVYDGGGKEKSEIVGISLEGRQLEIGYYSSLEQLPNIDLTIREYTGIR